MNYKLLHLMLMSLLVLFCEKATAQSVYAGSLSEHDANAPVGWAMVDGSVTGGNDQDPVTVTTKDELISALSGAASKTIYVSGTLTFTGSEVITNVQNKTIYGLPSSILQNPTHSATASESGILTFKNCSNIILRNLTFKAAGAYDIDGKDNLTLQNCNYMWVDHCDFQDGVDGNFDCNNGSDHICVSWCRFRYLIDPWSGGSGGSNDHRFSDLWGGGDSASGDEGKLNTTFVNCWWDEGCKQRMPRIRFGKVHILNCLYSSTSADYCVGGGYKSNVYIEKCAFTSLQAQSNPWMNFATSGSYTDYNYTLTGCTGADDAQNHSGDIDYFVPADTYTYTAYESSLVESVVSNATNGAGATLTYYPVTAKWDFQNQIPASITNVNIQGTNEGDVASDVTGIVMHVISTGGKLAYNSSGYAQFNSNTTIQVPVKTTSDVVTVVSYPGQSKYTVGGEDATGHDTFTHTAVKAEVTKGYVEITPTENSTAYLYSIQVVQNAPSSGPVVVTGEEASATFAFDLGTLGQKATFSNNDYFISSNVELGSNMSYFGTRSISSMDFTCIQPVVTTSTTVGENDYVKFLIRPKAGLKFTPTKVSLKASKVGTDNGTLDLKWQNTDNTMVVLANGVTPQRNNATPAYSSLEYTAQLSGATAGEGTCGLVVYIYGKLANNKQMCLRDIVIEGTLSGTEQETPVLASFEINGTEYSVDQVFGEGYEADLELSKTNTMVSSTNPLTNVTATTGTVGTITYVGDDTQCKVTIPMTLNSTSIDYVLNVSQKPDYTLTYYDTDGTTSMGTQLVEKGATIGAFDINYATATAADGYAVRGWFKSTTGGEKYKTTDVVTGNLSLYAVATEIEVASNSKTYTFNLNDPYFYAEDHEAFSPQAGALCKYHDNTHGWSAYNGDKIDLLVGAKATISIAVCKYGNGTNLLVKKGDTTLATLDGMSSTDGDVVSYNYEGEAGTLTLEMVASGEMYIHNVKIINTSETNYTKVGQWYMVKKGDVSSFTEVLAIVNSTNGSTSAVRSFIFLPNGTYNLGTATKTQISGHNISIIGENRDGVIIKNRPEAESINATATLWNTGTNNYLQDLTLDCIAPNSGSAERGVCLMDEGNKTICKNVKLAGRQDSYYCHNNSGQFYFEDGVIEGTVDYICGNGDVYFNRTKLYNVERASGSDVIAAPNTPHNFGYIFNNCTIDGHSSQDGVYSLGRPWAESGTKCLYVNTTMQQAPLAAGWTDWSPEHAVSQFAEYNSVDGTGAAISLASRKTSFNSVENTPVITAAEAASYMVDKVNWDNSWAPATLMTLFDAPTVSVSGTTASWDAVAGATAYALYKDGALVGITTDTEYTVDGSGTYTLRVANSMGGFGAVTGTTPTVSPTIGATGYASFSCSHALDFSSASGVKAYVATAISDGKLMMTKVTGAVPANTGLFLQKDGEGAISIPVVPTASAPATNLLKPSVDKTVVAASTDGAYHYVFALQGGSVGFYNLTNPTNLPAGKAYLETTAAVSSPVLMLDFGGTTSINEELRMKSEEFLSGESVAREATAPVYNLAGQRVAQPTKGLYIVNGRKVIIK